MTGYTYPNALSKCFKRASSFDLEPIYRPHWTTRMAATLAKLRRWYMRTGVIANRRVSLTWSTYA